MIVDYGNRNIGLKIVFFGPAMSGKTTSVRWLFKALGCPDRLSSIENTLGRTMFCDYGTLSIPISSGWSISAHVWTATGQDFYRATRDVVMTGTDGVVFVADSQRHLLDDNIASWNELVDMIDSAERIVPVVILLNKYDMPNPIGEQEFRSSVKIPLAVPIFPSVARNGTNILEAFQMLFQNAIRASILPQASVD